MDVEENVKEVPLPRLARYAPSNDEEGSFSNNITDQNNDSEIALKENHCEYPLWISYKGRIFLENFNPSSENAHDFLVAISEPVSRPAFIHEYKLTPYSLFAAVSTGLETADIIDGLERLSKTFLSPAIKDLITSCTESYGKVKIVLKENKYWIESVHFNVLRKLLEDDIISISRDHNVSLASNALSEKYMTDFIIAEDLTDRNCLSFPIKNENVELVKRRCVELDYPLLEEYDFSNDIKNQSMDISLKPTTNIRPYQEKALGKMFANGRARSGVIVLPCGAGKTLVGITAMTTIKKSTLVLCTSAVAVEQWRQQIKYFSTISDSKIARFTSDSKERFEGECGIVISTYSMIAYSGRRSYEAKKSMEFIRSIEWGLVLLDEVHVVPANVFRKVISSVAAHTKLGLTATLVREDDKIEDLNFLIGPKLYEANWQDLAQQGHIAQVQCAEVWCEMTAEFYGEYLKENSRKKRLIYAMNPIKFHSCQFLIQYHEQRGDKIIVFSDDLYALKAYALKLKRPYICGSTPQSERMLILHQFQSNSNVNTVFLSKVGDTSIDLPEATCLIQISSHFGSRRQEAQRLGRILRARRRNDQGFYSFFYTLVSKDTEEMYYSSKRQQFLIDQGYSFKVITQLKGIENFHEKAFASKEEQISLLQQIAIYNEDDINEEPEIDDFENSVVKSGGTLQSLSGAGDMAYIEHNRRLEITKQRHPLFSKRKR